MAPAKKTPLIFNSFNFIHFLVEQWPPPIEQCLTNLPTPAEGYGIRTALWLFTESLQA